ncbi:hypothetical protein NH621_01375 [Lactococcus formosensis]|uniref:hypothetical protein n=1 Tax=Lactococcus formosensis TaxID=1281486 RepID=UPI0020984E18|nr:hypothetical protein [Lactococcus formosensis]MCO7179836.1 hypothetical protein [Lactococcus formosensis]
MKKKIILSSILGAAAFITFGGNSVVASGQYGEVNSVQNRVAIAQSMFADSKPTDKVLRVDGGYLQGEMISTASDVSEIYYNSDTDINSITVAEAQKIEIEKAQSTTDMVLEALADKNPRFVDVPTNSKGLQRNGVWKSGPFNGGKGWEFAGWKFYNLSGARNMTWYTFGDIARAGDMADAKAQKRNPTGTYGIQLNPGIRQDVYPTDGGIYTTYYSWKPANGSYYIAVGQ